MGIKFTDSEGNEGDTDDLKYATVRPIGEPYTIARKVRDYVRDNFVYGSLDSLSRLETFVRKTIEEEQS